MKILFLIVVSCLLAACQQGNKQLKPDDNLERIYLAMEEAADNYRKAIEYGNADDAQQALITLLENGEICSATSSCEAKRFLYLYTEILEQQASRLNSTTTSLGEQGFASDRRDEQGESPVLNDLPVLAESVNLLNGRELRDIIRVNEPVKAALNEWLTWMRPVLMDSFENYQYLRSEMWPEYEKAGLPEALLFGILAKESAGKVHAVSSAGAAGLLQFMPATGRRFGLGVDASGFDTRFDPQSAAQANVRYIEERFRQFNHDLGLSLAAYNAGESRVGRLVKKTGKKNFWDPVVYDQLPPETRDYVPMVLAAAWLFLHPEDYGLTIPALDTSVATLTLQGDTSLNSLAICIGTYNSRNGWFRMLRNLNPRYTAHESIPARTQLQVPSVLVERYQQQCVTGKSVALAHDIARAAKVKYSTPTGRVSNYVVRSGDSLDSIARRFSCSSSKSLAQFNGIAAPRFMIKPGQSLRLDGCKG